MTTQTTLLIVAGVGVAGFAVYELVLKPKPAPAAASGIGGLFNSLLGGVTTAIPSFISSIESAFSGGSSVSPNQSS